MPSPKPEISERSYHKGWIQLRLLFVVGLAFTVVSLTSAMLLRQCIDALAGAINKFSGGVVLATKQKYCVKTCTH